MKNTVNRIMIVISFLLSLFGNSQEKSIFNELNIQKINSIDWKNFQYKEIECIDSVDSKNKILILSERDHGHGSSMDAQCMILKGLIDSSRINVIYIESSWINCDRITTTIINNGIAGSEEAKKYIQSYDLLYWVKNGFWEYLVKKIAEGKVLLKGFDISGVSPIIAKELFSESLQLSFSKEFAFNRERDFKKVKLNFDYFKGWGYSSYYTKDAYVLMMDYVKGIMDEYSVHKEYHRVRQWKSILNFFYWMYKRAEALIGNKYATTIENSKQESFFNSIRDSSMAAIFLETYKADTGKKVVCSMSSYHALKNGDKIDDIENCCKDSRTKTMGEILDKALPDEIFNICFITASGKYGIDDLGIGGGSKIKTPKKGSIEFFLNRKNLEYCFINLKKLRPDITFYMNAVFNRYLNSVWQNNFSGIFFIKEMKPLVLIKP